MSIHLESTLLQVGRCLAVALPMALALPLHSQTQFTLDASWPPSSLAETGQEPYLADFDGDGDLDLFVVNGPTRSLLAAQQCRLYLNEGRGTFRDATAANLPQKLLFSTRAAIGDVDGDGDGDLVIGCGKWGIPERDQIFLNDGNGVFTDATLSWMPNIVEETQSVALGDVDGDGDLDLVCGGRAGQNRLYINQANALFADETQSRLPSSQEITNIVLLADFDDDGDLDLFAGNMGTPSEQNRLYLNDGSGVFSDHTQLLLPPLLDSTVDATVGDIDGDGDADLVVANRNQPDRLYRNDGGGSFSDISTPNLPQLSGSSMSYRMADVDEDGDLDLVNGRGGMSGQDLQNRLLLGDGTGAFLDATASRMPAVVDQSLGLAIGDVDGDLDLDLVFANTGPGTGQADRLYLNRMRQVAFASPPARGQVLDVVLHAEAGFAGQPLSLVPALDLAPAVHPPLILGGFGAWNLGGNPIFLAPLQTSVQLGAIGSAHLAIPVPNEAWIGGLLAHVQAIVVHRAYPLHAGLTNAAVEAVR